MLYAESCLLSRILPAAILAMAGMVVSASAQETRIRVAAANISSGNLQSYPIEGPGARILRALAPDIVLIQEFNVGEARDDPNDAAAVQRWVDAVFGAGFSWCREPGGDQIPNGIISRWTILECGEWEDPNVGNRDFAFARIDIPGEIDLWAVSVHLLTRNSSVRNSEAGELVDAILSHPVPAGDYLVLGGDFNTDSRSEPALATLSSLFVATGPFPDDGGSPPDGDTNASRRKPYDWVLADSDLQFRAAVSRLGMRSYTNGLVFDTRIFDPPELDRDFAPARQADSAAVNMQHMAVVRDFVLETHEELDIAMGGVEVDFGTRDADRGPFEVSLAIEARNPVHIVGVEIAGQGEGEFSLLSPSPDELLSGDSSLRFGWRPVVNDGAERAVRADLRSDGNPPRLTIELRGATLSPPGRSESLSLGDFVLEQSGGSARFPLPAGLTLEVGQCIVIGRDATRAAFEDFWGQLSPDALYFDGMRQVGGNGFPVVNGSEHYRLRDASGRQVDPVSGFVPTGATPSGRCHRRVSPSDLAFEAVQAAPNAASPGRCDIAFGKDSALITEFCDAPGAGNFRFEFVEVCRGSAGEN